MSSRAHAAAIFWLVILALSATAVHHDMVDRGNYERQREMHDQIVSHKSVAPYQYRVLQPMVVEGVMGLLPAKAGEKAQRVAFFGGYGALRFISIFAALLGVFYAIRRISSDATALFAATAIGALLPFTFKHYYFQPTSVTELALFAWTLWIILARRVELLWPLVLLGSLNRETTCFLPFLYFVFWLPRLTKREWLYLVVAGGCWLLVYLGLRWTWPVEMNLWENERLDRWRFGQLGRNFDTILIHCPLLIVFFGKGRIPEYSRLAFCSIIWFAIHFAMTHWWEIRYYLPSFVWSMPACLYALELVRPLEEGNGT